MDTLVSEFTVIRLNLPILSELSDGTEHLCWSIGNQKCVQAFENPTREICFKKVNTMTSLSQSLRKIQKIYFSLDSMNAIFWWYSHHWQSLKFQNRQDWRQRNWQHHRGETCSDRLHNVYPKHIHACLLPHCKTTKLHFDQIYTLRRHLVLS